MKIVDSREETKPVKGNFSFNPILAEEIYKVEFTPFKEALSSKCRYIVSLDDNMQELMEDPEGNASRIKYNLDTQKRLSEDITVSNNLLRAVKELRVAYLNTTVNMYEAWQKKEKSYLKEIKALKSHIGLLQISYMESMEGGQNGRS